MPPKRALLRWTAVTLVLTSVAALGGCLDFRRSRGGGETKFDPPRLLRADDVALPGGYTVQIATRGLTFPTGIAFDDEGRPYVVEAGYASGEVWTTPRLLRLNADGSVAVVAEGGKNGPWTGVAFHDGSFYVAEGGELEGGRILRITPDGEITPLISGLPSRGDHHTNGPAIGADGRIYFSIGTYTNSGIVGEDNVDFGWVRRFPQHHDIPCRDIRLTGVNHRTREAETGAYVPYGTRTVPGQVIHGEVPCNGAVLALSANGGAPELIAWGFRNPFGLAFAPDGALYVTDNSYDDRGSRPVHGAGDLLWRVERGRWYGWPEFHGTRPLDDDDHFDPPDGDRPTRLLMEAPGVPPEPVAVLGVHSSANSFDFSRSEAFGHTGEAFVALFGDQAPVVGKVSAPVGFKVVRVRPADGTVQDFAVNRGSLNGPASKLGSGGLERPIAARFDPAGDALYVVDFGVLTMSDGVAAARERTGSVWKITRAAVGDGR